MKERAKRTIKYLAITVGVVVACCVGILLWLGWLFGAGMCGHQVPQVIMSPDGKQQALVFEGDCGASDHFHTWVSVLPTGKQLGEHELGNVFGMDGDLSVTARWVDATHLHIEYPPQPESHIHFRKNNMHGVYIEYAEVQ